MKESDGWRARPATPICAQKYSTPSPRHPPNNDYDKDYYYDLDDHADNK